MSKELNLTLGIKFNFLYMPLLNDNEVTFILDFMCMS